MLVVFGSINLDYNFKLKSLPQAGETVLSSEYTTSPGGKGANQAIAAARMGAKTAIVGKVGDDGMGQRILAHLRRNEVMTSGVARSEKLPTGMASVMRDENGENAIIVASGANVAAAGDQVPDEILHDQNVVLMQMELPLPETIDVVNRAYGCGAKVVLNLAPAMKLPLDAMKKLDVLIVNQIEARQLASAIGVDANVSLQKLAQALSQLGEMACIITLGGDGLVAVSREGDIYEVPSMKLEEVVDTAGSGDCFCGTFAACLHEKKSFAESLQRSVVAAGLSCTKFGTQESYPYAADIEENLEKVALPQKK